MTKPYNSKTAAHPGSYNIKIDLPDHDHQEKITKTHLWRTLSKKDSVNVQPF